MCRGSLFTVSADSIWENRGEEGLLTGRIKEFSIAVWDSARSGSTSHGVYLCACVCVCVSALSTCLSILLLPPPLLSPLCLSLSNKGEYLFPPLRLSGLLKGVGDRADIRQNVCVCTCDSVCVCVCAGASVLSLSRCAVCLSHHPSQMYSCVFSRANTPRLKVADSEPRGLVEERPLAGADWAVLSRGRKVTVARYYLPAPIEFISIADMLWQNSV